MSSISVLTLLKGRRNHLRNLVEGLARSRQPPGELIVVNMDAPPLTIAPQPFPVRVLDFPAGPTLPLGAARNRAAFAAQHHLLLFLDVDCIVSARAIGAIAQACERQDSMLCPDVLYLPAGQPNPGWTEDALRLRGVPHPVRRFPVHGELREHNPGFLWSLAFATRAATFYRLGGFDERFTGYGAEDTDLGFRANAAGLPLIYLGGATIFHQHHTLAWPPLHHFADIVRNSVLFHSLWGIWPMEDRLDAFVAAGLLERTPTELHILRYPTADEIAAARQADTVLF
jgi:GT2 family glycosyltransferase